jgi:two-component system, chemotaxis family, chemotaxis protein CheY
MAHILLIEDDDALRTVLCLSLTNMGHQVVEARNGKEALRLFRSEPPDFVITDLIMPEKEGLETIGELRRLQPKVKIIAMSGAGRGGPLDYLKVARQMGAARTLAKPFSVDALAAAIAELNGSPPAGG